MPKLLPSEAGRTPASVGLHWIVLATRKPKRRWVVSLVVLLVLAYLWPWPWLLAFVAWAGVLGYLRYILWRTERVYLTNMRLIHVIGILETTRTEAWLRLDRIAGLRLDETIWGRLFGYVTIHIIAQGDHPGLDQLYRIKRGLDFYMRLRNTVFTEHTSDPDEIGSGDPAGDYITEELPQLPDAGHRYRRRG